MKVLLISHALVVDTYGKKIDYLAADPQNQVKLITPKNWKEAGQIVRSENKNGMHHTSFTFRLNRFHGATFLYGLQVLKLIRSFKPDIIHLEEEPYSLAALEVILFRMLMHRKSKLIFFTWQNIYKKYVPPFNLIEKLSLSCADGALAGNEEAVDVLKAKGFDKPIRVIPQIGVDGSALNGKIKEKKPKDTKKIIGYIGRLEYPKGIDILMKAVANLNIDCELWLIGNGTYLDDILQMADELKIKERLRVHQNIPHRDIPVYMRSMDVLVLPSRTGKGWKEQFGRVLVEAMSCGVPVIGSNSGAIPEVIGNAGLIFPENSVDKLHQELCRMLTDEHLRVRLAKLGRNRVLTNYTHPILVSKTLEFYHMVTASTS